MTERLFAQESLRTSFLTHRSVSKTRWHFTCSVEGTLRCELGLRLEAQWTPPTPIPTPKNSPPAAFFFAVQGLFVSASVIATHRPQ